MGSSRKEKDREERKHKHKHKDRDRDKDKDRKRRHKHKRDRSPRSPTSRPKRDASGGEEFVEPVIKRERGTDGQGYYRAFEESVEKRGEIASSGGGGITESMSIEETNKIRLKLGLAPLEPSNAPKQGTDGVQPMPESGSTDVHKPARNLAQENKRKAIQEKLQQIKAKREINKKLSKVKTLGEEDDVDDIHAWVERSRKVQKEKALAEKREKLLQEMDADFGIEALVDEEFKKSGKEKAYGSRDIAGLQVQHSLKSFKEGKSVILTLKDSGILDEEDDALVNVNMVDDILAARNTELRKGRPGYIPYEQEEVDEFGVVKKKSLLHKYDEEIEGKKVESFKLGESGSSPAVSKISQQAHIRQELQKQSLDMQVPTVASDYYTSAEMEKFKKPKKRRRKVKKFSVNDLTPEDSITDHGSRNGGIRRRNLDDGNTFGIGDTMDLDLPDIDGGMIRGPMHNAEVEENVVIEDDAALELQLALNKARRMKYKKEKKDVDGDKLVAEAVKYAKGEEMDTDSTTNPSIVLNATSEFCRTLGEIPSYSSAVPKEEDNEDEVMDFEKEEPEQMGDEEGISAWSRVNLEEEDEEEEEEAEPLGPVLEEEPSLQSGVAGALKMAVNKGFLEKESNKKFKAAKDKSIEAQNFHVEDKSFHDIDAKYSKHDRFRGPVADFREKSGYKPSFNISYKDDSGRELNQKEAFRVLSHRFHGKRSGKSKTERRQKKIAGEQALLKMSSVDTPLGTVAMLQEKQRVMQSPYIMLSGSGSNVLNAANVMTKGKN
ncbi:U4/U6.U5 tri-snRNP-associated protein 1-like [Anneissia japonica]|uniref:U4/U6.U5 tri-snRNP-associated protein 1-like n=1 Tax=Anneissia japonica TaxID=1529436 RepID=UPI001425B2FC|nr:U4/U6.U5 tri-snRNP-associated protein 1-like [Anneissia japonica]